MGYNTGELSIYLRLDNHLGPETERDKRAAENLKLAIQELIDSDLDYRRIAVLGVEGGY